VFSRRRSLVVAAAVCSLMAGCSGGGTKPPGQVPTTTATTLGTTTTAAPSVAPLTGLPQPDGARLRRPAVVVKIDNIDPGSRPQSGLTKADVCVEEQVEGGITRFACIWQSTDADVVGPIRSTRTTDIAIVAALNHPLYAFSGGSAAFLAAIRGAPIVDVGFDVHPEAYFRQRGRPSPHNLFSRITALYGLALPGAGPPPAQFAYRGDGPASGSGVTPANHVDVKFPGLGGPAVAWDWDAPGHVWRRSQNGTPDATTDGGQISAANVVFQMVDYPIVDYQTINGGRDPIPMANLLGEGRAIVFTDGKLIPAKWSKPSATDVTRFTDDAGSVVSLTPGQTWVELTPKATVANTR